MKKAGVLAPLASLPGELGIGDFGKSAYQFIDMLKHAKFKIWQILPLGPLGFGNSPYQPYSSFAGDEIYISIEELKEAGLLNGKIIPRITSVIDYEEVRNKKTYYLKEAFLNFKPNKEYENFKKEQKWLKKYSIFITFKKLNNGRSWLMWEEKYKRYHENIDTSEYQEAIEYENFVQYIFFKQWFKLKKYANDKGIEILGDIPIYVGIDSCDVWANPNCFLLDQDYRPTHIAGVPPDYFSPTGQRWGNPIYNWDYLKSTNFEFWIERLAHNQKLYDMIRIDHFRAFDTYWKIPSSCPTAIEGEWVEAPGYQLLDTIYAKLPNINIVAEDLGDLRPEVLKLRDHYHIRGMRVVEFELNDRNFDKNYHAKKDTILYTGTHDNQTLKSWYKSLDKEYQRYLLSQYHQYSEHLCTNKIIHHVFDTDIDIIILPIQDLIGLDDNARINTPGTIGSPNWQWKLKSLSVFKKYLDYYRKLIEDSGR